MIPAPARIPRAPAPPSRAAALLCALAALAALAAPASADSPSRAPLPIDPLWQSESFRKAVTGSYGIDSQIEPRITVDEEHYLDRAAGSMAEGDRAAAAAGLAESSLLERSPAMLFMLATLLFEEGEVESARERFEQALELFPNFRDAHRNLAVVLVQLDELDAAETRLSRAVELGARDGLTLGLLGYCHALQDRHRAALDAYRLALLTQPGERQWLIGAAQALLGLERPREAASLLQQLIEEPPFEPALWLAQADAWLSLDDTPAALANLEFVHRSGALDAPGTLALGHLLLSADLPGLAVERYESALAADPPPPLARAVEALDALVSHALWAPARRVASAIEDAEAYAPSLAADAADGADTATLSRLHRARALIELEDGDAAAGAQLVEQWLRRDPADGAALILLSRFREGEDRRAEAEMLLEQAASFPEHRAEALRARGRLLVAAEYYEAALEHLREAQRLEPSESLAGYIEAVRELVR